MSSYYKSRIAISSARGNEAQRGAIDAVTPRACVGRPTGVSECHSPAGSPETIAHLPVERALTAPVAAGRHCTTAGHPPPGSTDDLLAEGVGIACHCRPRKGTDPHAAWTDWLDRSSESLVNPTATVVADLLSPSLDCRPRKRSEQPAQQTNDPLWPRRSDRTANRPTEPSASPVVSPAAS